MKKCFLLIILLIMLGVSFVSAQETFETEQQIVKTPHIGTLTIQLQKTVNPSEPSAQSVKFIIVIDDQFNNSMGAKNGDLLPYLTAAQITQLSNFMNMLWQKAENEILP